MTYTKPNHLCATYNISRSTGRRWVSAGKVRKIGTGPGTLWHHDDFRTHAKQHTPRGPRASLIAKATTPPDGWVMSKTLAQQIGVHPSTISKWARDSKIETIFAYDPVSHTYPRWVNPDSIPATIGRGSLMQEQALANAAVTREEYDHLKGYGIPHGEVVRRLSDALEIDVSTIERHLTLVQYVDPPTEDEEVAA